MDGFQGGGLHHISEGGVAGTHAVLQADDVLLAPTTTDEKNTVKAAIFPIACFRVDDIRFDFDSSFILPEVAQEMPHLSDLRDKHKDKKTGLFPPLSIFGHADPVGSDEYNKILSGRRAAAVYALLTRRVDIWEDIFSNKGVFTAASASDRWGAKALQTMHQTVNSSAASDDFIQKLTKDSVLRAVLFETYMDRLCGQEFRLKAEDFLAQGADKFGKGDYQGCSEFNPVMLFSQEEERDFALPKNKEARDRQNAPNRRVMVLLFRPGARVSSGRWPCPRAKEGLGGCRLRFWSDGEKRRTKRLPQERRRFEETADTFACRFYDRLTTNSPCEHTTLVTTLTIRMLDGDDKPFTNARYILKVQRALGGQDQVQEMVLTGATNENGILSHLIPADAEKGSLTLFPAGSGADSSNRSSDTPQSQPLWEIPLTIKPLLPANTVAGAQARLNNLGLFASETVNEAKTQEFADLPKPDAGNANPEIDQLKRALQRFQMLYKPHGDQETAGGNMDAETKAKLEEKHGS